MVLVSRTVALYKTNTHKWELYGTKSSKQMFAGRNVALLGHITNIILSQPVCVLTPECSTCKFYNPDSYTKWLNPWSTVHETRTITIICHQSCHKGKMKHYQNDSNYYMQSFCYHSPVVNGKIRHRNINWRLYYVCSPCFELINYNSAL